MGKRVDTEWTRKAEKWTVKADKWTRKAKNWTVKAKKWTVKGKKVDSKKRESGLEVHSPMSKSGHKKNSFYVIPIFISVLRNIEAISICRRWSS